MLRRSFLGAVALVALTSGMASAEGKTFYWISHGGPADPVWTYFLQGAEAWAKETGNTVNTSFYSGDVPSQQEAVRSAIAAKAAEKKIEAVVYDRGGFGYVGRIKAVADAAREKGLKF